MITSIEITATSAEGVVTPLLWIQEFRPEWRSPYLFAQPMALAPTPKFPDALASGIDREKASSTAEEPPNPTVPAKPSCPSPPRPVATAAVATATAPSATATAFPSTLACPLEMVPVAGPPPFCIDKREVTVAEYRNGKWVINGQTVTVIPDAIQNGPFSIGDQVKVEGVVNPDGSFTVSTVESPTPRDMSSLPSFGDDNSGTGNENNSNENEANKNSSNENSANENSVNENESNENSANENVSNENESNENESNENESNENESNENGSNENEGNENGSNENESNENESNENNENGGGNENGGNENGGENKGNENEGNDND